MYRQYRLSTVNFFLSLQAYLLLALQLEKVRFCRILVLTCLMVFSSLRIFYVRKKKSKMKGNPRIHCHVAPDKLMSLDHLPLSLYFSESYSVCFNWKFNGSRLQSGENQREPHLFHVVLNWKPMNLDILGTPVTSGIIRRQEMGEKKAVNTAVSADLCIFHECPPY